MSAYFDDVVGGVGMRPGEKSEDDFVNALCRGAAGFDQFRQPCLAGMEALRRDSAGCARKPQQRCSNSPRLWPGDAHYANATSPRRSRNSYDGVVKIHN